MEKMKIGINTDCECGETFKETLQNIKAAGFESIMVAEKSGDLDANLKLAREMGFEISFVHLGYEPPFKRVNDMWRKGSVNSEFIKDFKRKLEILHKYGVKIAVIHGSNKNDKAGTLYDSKGIAAIRKILKTAEKLQIRIAVENLGRFDERYLRILLDNINSPNLGFCYDVGHKNLRIPEADYLAMYGNRCFAIHLHDNLMNDEVGDTSGLDLHYLPFDGKIDFEKEISGIAASNYQGIIMLEVHRCHLGNKDVHPIYKNLLVAEYLKESYKRGEKLAEMFAAKRAAICQKNC